MPVQHLQIYRATSFGGTINTTLCGRVRNEQDYNVADTTEDVTCKFCLREMERRGEAEIKELLDYTF